MGVLLDRWRRRSFVAAASCVDVLIEERCDRAIPLTAFFAC
jgi:hypothetical protein